MVLRLGPLVPPELGLGTSWLCPRDSKFGPWDPGFGPWLNLRALRFDTRASRFDPRVSSFGTRHSGLSIIDHVSVLENFDGLKNHFLVMQHIVRYINIHTNECS